MFIRYLATKIGIISIRTKKNRCFSAKNEITEPQICGIRKLGSYGFADSQSYEATDYRISRYRKSLSGGEALYLSGRFCLYRDCYESPSFGILKPIMGRRGRRWSFWSSTRAWSMTSKCASVSSFISFWSCSISSI